jgi:tRNA pseudouridine38-40 synthase
MQPNAIAFTVDASRVDAALAAALGSLTLVEYVYLSLVACSAPSPGSVICMQEIVGACAAVPWPVFGAALSFWRLFERQKAGDTDATALGAVAPTKFRVLSKRGGGTHTFTSRDLKREVASVLGAAHLGKLEGCFKDHEFDLTARVHGSDFFLGLLLNSAPLFSALGRVFPPVDIRGEQCSRYCLTLAYDGASFHGWQKQPPRNGAMHRTIEEELELKLRPLVRQQLRFVASGRTDAGVSARGQVCQFDAVSGPAQELTLYLSGTQKPAIVPVMSLAVALNEALPADLRVLEAAAVPKGFCAMNPLWKQYTYTLPTGVALAQFCSDALREEILEEDLPYPDMDLMNEAASFLVGTHDFAGFQSKGGQVCNYLPPPRVMLLHGVFRLHHSLSHALLPDQKTTVRTIFKCAFAPAAATTPQSDRDSEPHQTALEPALVLTVEGDGFLMHQVRIIVGTLLQVGCLLRPPSAAQEALHSLCRSSAGPTVPPAGLCLEHAEYEIAPSFQAYRQDCGSANARGAVGTGRADQPPLIAALWARLNEVGRRYGGGVEGNLSNKKFARKRRNLSKMAAGAHTILEIGFNAGHSCALFWVANPRVKSVLAFDIGCHSYVEPCHQMLVEAGLRIELVLGDSRQSVPARAQQDPATKYDLIHIDGGHILDVPACDLLNCGKFAHRSTLVIVDDTGNLPQPRLLLPHAYSTRIANTILYLSTRIRVSHACTRLCRELPGPHWTTPAIQTAIEEALHSKLIEEVDYGSLGLETESDHRVFRYPQAPELAPR